MVYTTIYEKEFERRQVYLSADSRDAGLLMGQFNELSVFSMVLCSPKKRPGSLLQQITIGGNR
jgi:hypothetical protein